MKSFVGQAVSVLFGGQAHMTTAHSLTWTLLLLAQHPSIMQKLWLELNEASHSESASGSS